MKKTISVNLANRNFYIEEDAYNMLDEYIKTIRNYYRNLDPDGEVAQDFEARLSELFDEKLRLGYTVISVSMANDVIRQLGKIEDLRDEAVPGAEGESPQDESHSYESDAQSSSQDYATTGDTYEHDKTHRKLFREPRGKIIAGVLSGVAHYLDTDPMLIRLLFIILLFTPVHMVVVILYIVGWIFIPEAVSAADRLEMEGKEVNSENLWTKISSDAVDENSIKSDGTMSKGVIDNQPVTKKSSKNWVWWILAFIALAGAIATLIWLIQAVDNGYLLQFDFLPPAFDTGITIFAAILLALFAIGLGLLIIGLIIYVLGILPIGIIIRSKKMSSSLKVLLIIIWVVLLTVWIW